VTVGVNDFDAETTFWLRAMRAFTPAGVSAGTVARAFGPSDQALGNHGGGHRLF